MRVLIHTFGLILLCSGCVQAPPPPAEATISQVTERVAADDPTCRDYSAQAIVDGRQQQIVGRACQQSDGSWRVAEGPPNAPTQFQTVYWAQPYTHGMYYPYYDPWFLGPPIGLSLGGSFVFVDRFHRFHRFHHQFARDGFRHDGFMHGGFGRGGMGGMHHG
jgi:hypothetical protein